MCVEFGEVTVIIGLVINFLAFRLTIVRISWHLNLYIDLYHRWLLGALSMTSIRHSKIPALPKSLVNVDIDFALFPERNISFKCRCNFFTFVYISGFTNYRIIMKVFLNQHNNDHSEPNTEECNCTLQWTDTPSSDLCLFSKPNSPVSSKSTPLKQYHN